MTMIERVARTLYERFPSARHDRLIVHDRKVNVWHAVPWDEVQESVRDRFVADAHFALAAMREPTEAMVKAAAGADGEDGLRQNPESIWPAMIVAALEEDLARRPFAVTSLESESNKEQRAGTSFAGR